MKTEKENPVPNAVMTVINALESDSDYRQAWQANIAMSFQDAFWNYVDGEMDNDAWRKRIHTISNNAANNFLDVLCLTSKND